MPPLLCKQIIFNHCCPDCQALYDISFGDAFSLCINETVYHTFQFQIHQKNSFIIFTFIKKKYTPLITEHIHPSKTVCLGHQVYERHLICRNRLSFLLISSSSESSPQYNSNPDLPLLLPKLGQ